MPEIQEKNKEKKSSEARLRASAKYLKKARETGKYKSFNAMIDPILWDDLTNYCKDNNLSKAELLRQIADKIKNNTFEINKDIQ